jgi:hypothetical protein
MSKRLFRGNVPVQQSQPQYPTLDDFDRSRRAFLTRLGGVLLGAGALGPVLSGCSDRAITLEENEAGLPRGSDAGVDSSPLLPDGSLPHPDMEDHLAGDPMPPPSRLDARAPDQGPEWQLEGDVAPPDATIDQQVKLDWGLSGGAPAPDAKMDEPDLEFTMGEAPAMGAPIDKKGGGPRTD